MRLAGILGMAAMSALAVGQAVAAPADMPAGDWRTINRDLAGTRYSPLDQINRANVGQLKLAWSYPLKTFNTVVPIVVGSVMYFPAGSRVVALDADTGKEIWVHEEPKPTGAPGGGGLSGRGLGYWPGDAQDGPRILVMDGKKLLALDAKTGQPVPGFGEGGYAAVGQSAYGGTPTIAGDIAIIGAASLENPQGDPGNPRAFDVRTGKKLWEFQTVPKPGQPYNATWGGGWKDRGGTNMWGFAATVDMKTGTAYLPIGNPAHNYWGGDRPGNDVYGNSLVAVDLKTGKYKWHFQTVHHDLWDTDMPSAGPLIPVTIGGKQENVIANVSKSSWMYFFNAQTGKPVFPVKETPVPKGNVPGEWYSPTQPIPQVTPALSRTSFTKADMVTAADTTPEHAKACQELWDRSGGFINEGPFTPFGFHKQGDPPKSYLQLPGGTGGVNWGGPAADPTTGLVYVNAQDTSLVGWVEKTQGDKPYSFDATAIVPYDRASVDGKGPFFSFSAPVDGKWPTKGAGAFGGGGGSAMLPCYKPPWGQLEAIDAHTGKIVWAVPLGIHSELPEGKQLTGNSGSAGPTVTAGGLVFVGATNDKLFRAFDSKTGKELWEAQLGNNANANPMSYRGNSGKQYVAINAGGTIVAYTLT
ncbi:MAG TPA: PQQ-binding-like beta-propeller repeat protein [Sphingomonadaceae bacterium]